MSVLFEVQNAHVSYGSTEIVHGVSLSLKKGELCAFLGLNGSGKTTLLRGVCGLIPMEGQVFVDGLSLREMNEKERAQRLSFIPQISSPIQGKTVTEVMLMGANPYLGLLESPKREHYRAVENALEKLEIEEFADRQFHQLSQGQKQLVILARTLVQNSPVMLMDEPDSALDFRNRHMVLEKIRDVVKGEGKAGLITLHDPNFAMAYCDRLLLLKQGVVVAEIDMGTADEAEVRQKLSVIYGKIELFAYTGGYLMGKSR